VPLSGRNSTYRSVQICGAGSYRSGSVAQARIDSDTPSFVAIAAVAPGVLFSDLDIFLTPTLAFAIVFICRTSSLVHSRRTTFLV